VTGRVVKIARERALPGWPKRCAARGPVTSSTRPEGTRPQSQGIWPLWWLPKIGNRDSKRRLLHPKVKFWYLFRADP